MKIRNLTPHPINLECVDFGDSPADIYTRTWTIEPETTPARLREEYTLGEYTQLKYGTPGSRIYDESDCELADVPTLPHVVVKTQRVFAADGTLPDPADDTLLIVSRMVAEAYPERRDLVFPTELVRDPRGRVSRCKSLSRIYPQDR